jgi:hypothetical protein
MRRSLHAALVVAALAVALPHATAAEDLTVISTVTTPRGTTRTQTQYLSSSRMRLSGEERDTIVDLTSGRILILDNRRKEYSETSLDDLRAFFDQIDSAIAGRPTFDGTIGATTSVTVEKGTGGKKVAGYDTEPYILTMGDSMRMESRGPMARPFVRLYDEMKKIKGFPLAISLDQRMRVSRRQVSTEATEVRKGPIPDSVFAAPSDYKKVESPFGADRPPRPRPSP